jgi:peptidoglycan/xylan/chitin deacetylase (PgdA/CDA1 family)
MLWQNIDIQRLTRSATLGEPHVFPKSLPPQEPAVIQAPYRATLFVSRRSAVFFPDSLYYPNLVDQWAALIAGTGGQVSRISSAASIEALGGQGLLVAPSPVCLMQDEVTALRDHAERGGGLVLSWAAGARDSTCEWVGWGRVARLTGTSEVRELGQRDAVYITIPAGTPLSAGIDPGTRVELRYESQLAGVTAGPRPYWSDWALNSAPAADTRDVNAAAIAAWTDNGGRIVWLGFRLGHGATPEDDQRITRLAANGLRWAAELPVAQIANWPGGARSALLVTQDVEAKFENAAFLANIARRRNVPVTFFVVSRMVLDYPRIADSLTSAGEVGSQTTDHTLVAGLGYNEQRPHLERSWNEIRRWTGDTAYGLHPPEERFDENTLRAWREVGGTYLVAVNESRTAAPEVFETPAGQVVLLPRIIKDDYNVFVQESALRSVRLTEAYLQGMSKVRAIGGLAVVSTRTQVGGEPGRVRVVGGVIDSARSTGDWWIAAGRDISDWWLARRDANVDMQSTPDGLLRVRVTAPVNHSLSQAWLNLDLSGYPEDWTPLADGQPTRHVVTEWGLRVPLVDLAPGATTVITLRRTD